jgi:7,8-dihydropterin-6-yl-methyl-4-(beta-D-ribofuranosyl)aminobenzene 5'-phosphate synthase
VSSGVGLEPIALEPLDAVKVTTLVDNVTDSLLSDQGPAEHGFSALVTVEKAGREARVLFDAGRTPDGLVENMGRLDLSPATSRSSSSATVIGTTSPGWT